MHVENLNPVGHVDPSHTLKGPWKAIEVRSLEDGATLELQTTTAEYAIYTLEGRGRLLDGQNPVELKSGISVTLTKGSHARLQAVGGPLRFFMISFKL
jgi:mannose-6-phosphate isomerase-like protein (cupin superfamily)